MVFVHLGWFSGLVPSVARDFSASHGSFVDQGLVT